jgi:hypothetical protein
VPGSPHCPVTTTARSGGSPQRQEGRATPRRGQHPNPRLRKKTLRTPRQPEDLPRPSPVPGSLALADQESQRQVLCSSVRLRSSSPPRTTVRSQTCALKERGDYAPGCDAIEWCQGKQVKRSNPKAEETQKCQHHVHRLESCIAEDRHPSYQRKRHDHLCQNSTPSDYAVIESRPRCLETSDPVYGIKLDAEHCATSLVSNYQMAAFMDQENTQVGGQPHHGYHWPSQRAAKDQGSDDKHGPVDRNIHSLDPHHAREPVDPYRRGYLDVLGHLGFFREGADRDLQMDIPVP